MNNAGELNKKLSVWEYTTVRDELGGKVPSYVFKTHIWCSVKQLRMNEKLKAGAKVTEQIFTLEARESKSIDTKMYIELDGKKLRIKSIVPLIKKRGYIEIVISEDEA